MLTLLRRSYGLVGAHLPFPGLGHVGVEGKGYRWVPVEYSPLIVNTTK
ncbi:hypothetical protein [Budvicia aquatica]|nr:hypothetical protein [Budvicia aquatica]